MKLNTLKLIRLGKILRSDLITKPVSASVACCRCFSVNSSLNKAYLANVTVIGAGHMGTGIGLNNGIAGNNVTIADVSQESLDRSRKKVEERVYKVNRKKLKGKSEDDIQAAVNAVLKRIRWTTDVEGAVLQSDLVVESVPERIDVKHKLFAKIDKIAPPTTIFTTNTSSLPITEIAHSVSSERKKNFGGTHFFDRDVKLLEVIRLEETTNETYFKLTEWAQFIGKVPIACKDTPGFIVNRLNLRYFVNAMQMYERGDADMKDIDLAMKFGAGYPFGPFELADHIGLDVIYDILQGWQGRFPAEEGFPCPEPLIRLYKEGKYGRKTGEGFFKY